MYNLLLLGNGFDLHYNLPTTYRDFLLIADFLGKHKLETFRTIGDILGKEDLQAKSPTLKNAWIYYKSVWDSASISHIDLWSIVDKTKGNPWFNYFAKSFNMDGGWIDFEKEIEYVIRCFQNFFDKVTTVESLDELISPIGCNSDRELMYVCTEIFGFYLNASQIKTINKKYITEKPNGSGNKVINKKEIIKELEHYFSGFVLALRKYLSCFVENNVEALKKTGNLKALKFNEEINQVISFNYTRIWECISPNIPIHHIHGELDDCMDIVLGVSSNTEDDKEFVGESFLSFKKFIQRSNFNLMYPYWKVLREVRRAQKSLDKCRLWIVGHSLDKTDADIFGELFKLASEIKIFSHDYESKKQHIRNLAQIFGRAQFERFGCEHRMEFLDLEDVV